MKDARQRIYLFITLLAAALPLWLCPSCGSSPRGDTDWALLDTIDNSIAAGSPDARRMIDSAMKAAKDSTGYYECAVRLARWHFMTSPQPDSAFVWLDRTEAFAERHDSPRAKALLALVCNTRAAYYHNFHAKTTESISLYRKAYRLLMESGREKQAPNVCANLADAYIYENKLPVAAAWYRRALFLTDSLHLPYAENLSLYMGLASIYSQLGDYEHALKLYQETDRHFGDMQVAMQAYFLNNYASYYYYRKDYGSSLRLFRRLERFLESRKMGASFDMQLCRLNLADVQLNLGNTSEATHLLDEVEPFWQKTGDPTAMYYCTTIRLGIAVAKGDTKAARSIISADSGQGNMEHNMRSIRNRYMRVYYEQQGDWRSAYLNLKNDIEEDDSLEHNIVGMRAADIMSQYAQDTLRLHNSLTMEQKNAEMSRMSLWLVVAVAAGALLLMALLLFVHRSRQRQLQSQMQILRLRLERARGRISPHFMFNVLNNQMADAASGESKHLQDIAKLIRANLDIASNITVSLGEELDFVQKYVTVERRLLVDDDFDYTVSVDTGIDAAKISIPSMFIQIMVENAFVHGLMGRTGHKTLAVRVAREDGGMVVTVTDNGPGFDIHGGNHRRTGLDIIWQTMSIINGRNRRKMTFDLHNVTRADGETAGCEARLFVPGGMRYPEWNNKN